MKRRAPLTSRMRLIVVCSPTLTRRLESVIGDDYTLMSESPVAAFIWSTLSVADVVVIEPYHMVQHDERTASRLLAMVSASRVLTYTTTDAASVRATLDFARSGITHAVLYRFDDSRAALRAVIDAMPSDRVIERLIGRLRANIDLMPVQFANVLVDALRRPQYYASSGAICDAGAIPRRSCDRWFADSGLVSLSRLLTASRVARSLPLLRDSLRNGDAVAAMVGVPSARKLGDDVRRVTGRTLHDFRRMSENEVLESAVHHVCDRG
ncbi:MAG: hypothetical protein JWM41_2032 [Gemmatimonadetes bacterium]|nr:hypothetical protein [Gemmatimonadota bacterium]